MMIMGLGALLNIILDPILMTVMGEYAIEGAALATITAQFVQAAVTLHYFLKRAKLLKFIRYSQMRKLKRNVRRRFISDDDATSIYDTTNNAL